VSESGYRRAEICEQLERDGRIIGLECTWRRRDGETLYMRESATVVCDADGSVLFYQGTVEDISEQKLAEDALRESEERFRATFEQAAVGISHVDIDGRFLRVNRKLCEITGYERDELLELNIRDVTHPDDIEADVKFGESLEKGEIPTYSMEKRYIRKDGAITWVNLTVSLVRKASGDPDYFIDVVEDISARKQAEEALSHSHEELEGQALMLTSANRELEAFAHTVSHDLRAPLRRISGWIDLILTDNPDDLGEEGRRRLQLVQKNCREMDNLVNVMLEFSRMLRVEPARVEVDLSAMAQKIAQRLRDDQVDLSAMAQKIAQRLRDDQPKRRVDFQIAEGLRCEGNPRLLGAVLENLLSNAWKYTRFKKKARIEFGAQEREGRTVFYVRDNGVGFDQAKAGKLFVPFQRLHNNSEFEGVGIGLATVQRIIHRHGGQVWAEGETGKGAVFYFTVD